MTLSPLLVAAALAFAPAARADDELCGDCKTTGRIPHEHSEASNALEQGCIYCTEVMDADPQALGLDWMPCPKCKAKELQRRAKDEFELEFGKRTKWLQDRRASDKLIGGRFMYCETRHFVICFGIPEIKIGKHVVRQHEAMHIYAGRAETLYATIRTALGIPEEDNLHVKHYLYMFESLKHAQVAALNYATLPVSTGQSVSKIGNISVMSSWDDREKIGDDEQRHQYFTHNVSHHIVHDLSDYKWWLFDKSGWLHEGMAFYWESRLFGAPITSCTQEGAGAETRTSESWEADVRKMVIAGDIVGFANLIERNAATLTVKDRKFAWSYVDFLMWYDPKAMGKLLHQLEQPDIVTRDAIKKTYGFSIGELQEQWEAFVKAEYAAKPKKGPVVHEPRKP